MSNTHTDKKEKRKEKRMEAKKRNKEQEFSEFIRAGVGLYRVMKLVLS